MPEQESERWVWALLGVIVLWGLLGAGWFATVGLYSGHNWDERYVFENVKPVLQGWGLEPVNGWYPRLSYLPQTALLAISQAVSDATGNETLAVFKADGRFSASAYLICRWLNTLFGAGCLVVTFLIGRRMFSPGVGLVAALLQSMAPWHIRAAAVFKPDPLLILLMSLTFYWSLRAVEKGTLRTYVLCGAGVGLAASAKTPGVFASIPLITLTLIEAPKLGRLWRLVVAGVTAIVVFSVVNGDPLYYLGYARSEHEFLTTNQPVQKSFSWMLGWTVEMLGDWSLYGPVLGVVSLVGMAGLAVLFYHRRRDPGERARLAMFLSLLLVYPIVVSAMSDLPKGNYLLPILPLTAIATGWVLILGWRWSTRRLAPRPRRWLAWPAVIALILLAGRQGLDYVHYGVTTTTTRVAVSAIQQSVGFLNHRLAIVEPGEEPFRLERARGPRSRTILVSQEEPALSAVPIAVLDRADYEVFGEARLIGPEGDFYRSRIERLEPWQVTLIRPKFFEVRGSAQVLLTHPWHLDGSPRPVEFAGPQRRKHRFVGRLPAGLGSNRTISLDLAFDNLVQPSGVDQVCQLTVAQKPQEIFWYHSEGGEERWMTKRFEQEQQRAAVRLRCDRGSGIVDSLSSVDVVRWSVKPNRRFRRRQGMPAGTSEQESGAVEFPGQVEGEGDEK